MKAYREGAAVAGAAFGGGGFDIAFLAALTDGEDCGVRRRRREVVKNRDGPTGCAARGRARRGRDRGSRVMPREKLAIGA